MALCRRWFIQKDLDVVLSRSVLALPTYLIVPTLSVGLSTRIVLWKIHVVCLESQNDKSSETRALELTTVTLLVHLIFFYYSFVNTRFYDPETNPTRSLDHGGTLYIHAFISLSYSVSRSLFDLIPSACNLTSETDSRHLNHFHACIH